MNYQTFLSEEYMLKISSLVRSLHLDPEWNFFRTRTETPHIILGMLSKKVDKLLIEDQYFRDFTYSFSQEMIAFLVEVRIIILPILHIYPNCEHANYCAKNGTFFSNWRIVLLYKSRFQHIPQLGKKIWFQASCLQNATVISSYDNYQIEGNLYFQLSVINSFSYSGETASDRHKRLVYVQEPARILCGHQACITSGRTSHEEIDDHQKA